MSRWLLSLTLVSAGSAWAELPIVYQNDFESGTLDGWVPTEAAAWAIVDRAGGGKALALTKRISAYNPKHRSPHNINRIEGVVVSDFQLDLDVRSPKDTGAHRDVCLFFGYQEPLKYYYSHVAKKGEADNDPGGVRANSIFLVNDAPRKSIATERVIGVNWTDDWHHVRVTRNATSGEIAIYFDDMAKPVMRTIDKTFTWGQVGVGSFDDMGEYDNVVLRGTVHQP